MAKILILTPEGQQERDLSPHNTLGRHPNNSIQLLDRIVSKEHCTLEQRQTLNYHEVKQVGEDLRILARLN